MKIWTVGLLLVFLLPVVAVSTANATHSTHFNTGKGTVALTSSVVVSGPKVVSDHTTIVTVRNTFHITGTLAGTAVSIERDVMHNVTVATGTIITTTFHGLANFTGTLSGMSGTLRIRYEGFNNSTFIKGHFTVFAGTSQLAGVHGQGPFSGAVSTEVPLNYTIRWTVTTHTDHPEAREADRDRD